MANKKIWELPSWVPSGNTSNNTIPIDNNFSILIFPEGRRGAYGQPGNYQSGIGILYQELNVTVVPISLNSGKFWARRSKFKKPGCITLEFLDPIPAGLPRTEFMQLLQERIESGCAKL